MEINEYQESLRNFRDYPTELGMYYTIFGAQVELGKLAEKIKATLDEQNAILSDKDKKKIGISIGDIFYWLTSMVSDLGLDLEQDILLLNIHKLNLTKERQINDQVAKNMLTSKQ